MNQPRNTIFTALSCRPLIALIVLVTFSVESGVRDFSKKSSLLSVVHSKGDANARYAVIDGKKASSTTVLVRTRRESQLSDSSLQLLQQQGFSIEHAYSLVPGLMQLTFENDNFSALEGEKSTSSISQTLTDKLKQLKRSGFFEYVEPDWLVSSLGVPTDEAYLDGTLW